MPSTPDDIPSLIQREPVLQVALARGMTNAKGAARWLKAEYDLEPNAESIARHIREFEPPQAAEDWTTGREAIRDGTHHIRSDMALLIIRRSGKAQQRLAKILGNLDDPKMHAVRIEPTRRYFQVVIHGDLKETFERQLAEPSIKKIEDDLVEVSVVTNEPTRAPSPALSAALRTLHQRNIEVLFATSGPAGITLLIPADERFEGHELVKDLTGSEDED